MAKRVHRIAYKQIGNRTLNMGHVGENLHTKIVFDCTDLLDENPGATVTLKAIPPGGELYQPDVTENEGYVTWELTNDELQTAGSGQYQMTITNGTEIIKSAVGSYAVNESLPTA